MTVRQTTRVPKHLHAWLADRAKANHRSLNAELISILTEQKTSAELSADRSPIKTFIPDGFGGGKAILADGTVLESVNSVTWTPTAMSGTRGGER